MFAQKLVTYFTDLKQAGVPENQAAIHAEKLAEFMENNLATKEDLKYTEERLNAKIDMVEQRLDAKIDGIEQRLDAKVDGVEQRLGSRIDHLSDKIDHLSDKIERVSGRLEWFFKIMGFFVVLLTLINLVFPHFPTIHF